MSPAYRRVLKAARLVHVYLTLFGLALILFFAVTGFMLNHEAWFGTEEPHVREAEGKLPIALVQANEDKPLDKLAIVETLRRDFGIAGAMDSFHESESDVEVIFIRPGQRVVAEIQRETGEVRVNFQTSGFAAVLMDLHKGKSSGAAWSLVIDGVSIALLVIALTGFVLWTSLRSRGKWGAAALLAGLGLGLGIYFLLVP